MKSVAFTLLFALTQAAFAMDTNSSRALNKFTFDGCTLFPEGTRERPKLWEECCFEHDLRFWAGGTAAMRQRADLQLQECVTEKGEPEIAKLMYAGVRLGSRSPFKKITKGHWGNSWQKKKYYRELNDEEILLIQKTIALYSIPSDIEIRFLESLQHQN